MTTRPPFRRVLVANRGEIALRVIRACHELGSEAVAVYSDADAGAPFVRAADHAVRIGPPPAPESYLRTEAILDAAAATGADAVHPGYGFLSERAEFAAACAGAGLTFVGPSPATLAGLGDKLAARRAAAAAGVPIVPGMTAAAAITGPADAERVAADADRIGWPVMVKAAGGGGGRGMRRVDDPSELPAALLAATREADAAFGHGAVYLERLIEGARHVEVQLLGDRDGHVVALGERDCSVQRRHQKLVEEAPAPGLTAEARRALHAHGVAVANAVGLENAATAEFLLEPSGEAWFLEVNARLQVEHGVTELVTGLDLVHEQLRIAAREPLSDRVRVAAAAAATPQAHAIEVRISAEDPAREFAPLPGTLGVWREPGGPGVRVDSGVEQGSRVGSEYDPLLAKVMVVGQDRAGALARLARALGELRIAGIQTTLPFHRWLVGHAAFARGDLSTDFIARNWEPGPLRDAARALAADVAARAAAADADTPALSTVTDGWRSATTDSAAPWGAAGRVEATERWPP